MIIMLLLNREVIVKKLDFKDLLGKYDLTKLDLESERHKSQNLNDDVIELQTLKRMLSENIQHLEGKLDALDGKLTTAQNDNEVLSDQLATTQSNNDALSDQLAGEKEKTRASVLQTLDIKAKLSDLQLQKGNVDKKLAGLNMEYKALEERIGLVVKERNMVFIIDISGSMNREIGNDRLITQVVSGVKMVLATMNETYKADIIVFPDEANKQDYNSSFGELRDLTNKNKNLLFDYLNKLKPDGGTPTEEVLTYTITHPKYSNCRTIILLTDGEPTSNKSIGKIESDITLLNNGKKIINTIGVGPDFRERKEGSKLINFLKELAKNNGGSYIGF